MTHRGDLSAECEAICPDMGLVVFRAKVRIFFNLYPEGGDGWNEPREPRQAEFDHATTGGHEVTDPLIETWARAWLDAHEDEAFEAGMPDPDTLREMRQEREWEECRQGDHA